MGFYEQYAYKDGARGLREQAASCKAVFGNGSSALFFRVSTLAPLTALSSLTVGRKK